MSVVMGVTQLEKNFRMSDGNYFHVHEDDSGYGYYLLHVTGFELEQGHLEYGSDVVPNLSEQEIMKILAEQEELIELTEDYTDISELADISQLEEVSQEFIDELIEEGHTYFNEQLIALHRKYQQEEYQEEQQEEQETEVELEDSQEDEDEDER